MFLLWNSKFPAKILGTCRAQLQIWLYKSLEINSCARPAPRILAENLLFHNKNTIFVSAFLSDMDFRNNLATIQIDDIEAISSKISSTFFYTLLNVDIW